MTFLILAPLGIFLIFLIALPKGNVLHEVFHLPFFWYKMLTAGNMPSQENRFRYGAHKRQYYLMLEPQIDREELRGAVIYFHGGGWQFGAPEAFRPSASVFLSEGYAVIMPSVRRIPRHSFTAMQEDLKDFMLHFSEMISSRQWDDRPVFIGGMSSGGHLAAHLAYNPRIGLRPNLRIAGLMFFGAPLDLDQMPGTPVIRSMAGSRAGTSFINANPLSHIPGENDAAVLFVHGTHDGLVPLKSAVSFEKKLRAVQKSRILFHTIPEGTHLDAAGWGHSENELRNIIREWLREHSGKEDRQPEESRK